MRLVLTCGAITKRPKTRTLSGFFPIFYYLCKTIPSFFATPGEDCNRGVSEIIRAIVEQHKETIQGDSFRDFIDVYLAETQRTTDPESVFYKQEGGKRA